MTKLRILSAGAVKRGVSQVAAEFERATRAAVSVEFATAPEVRRRSIAGEIADVIVAPPAILDELATAGRIVAHSRAFVGRSRMGVVVHKDAPQLELRDAEEFRNTLLGATAIAYNRASSGAHAAKLVDRLGLRDGLSSRIVVVDTGAQVMDYVAGHAPGAIGLAQISEVMVHLGKGLPIRLAGPLPEAVQNETSYEAAAAASSADPQAALELARALGSPHAKKIFLATGIT